MVGLYDLMTNLLNGLHAVFKLGMKNFNLQN